MSENITIAVFDGFDEIDVFGPFEILSAAGYEVRLATLGASHVRSMRGVTITTEHRLEATHGVLVPGGGWLDRAPVGAWAEVDRGELTARLVEIAADSDWVASVCSGAMVLAHAGLLAGRPATTNRACLTELEPLVGTALNERVVDDGDRITAGALFAGVDLGLWIVERALGTAVASDISDRTGYTRQGRVWLAPAQDIPSPSEQSGVSES